MVSEPMRTGRPSRRPRCQARGACNGYVSLEDAVRSDVGDARISKASCVICSQSFSCSIPAFKTRCCRRRSRLGGCLRSLAAQSPDTPPACLGAPPSASRSPRADRSGRWLPLHASGPSVRHARVWDLRAAQPTVVVLCGLQQEPGTGVCVPFLIPRGEPLSSPPLPSGPVHDRSAGAWRARNTRSIGRTVPRAPSPSMGVRPGP